MNKSISIIVGFVILVAGSLLAYFFISNNNLKKLNDELSYKNAAEKYRSGDIVSAENDLDNIISRATSSSKEVADAAFTYSQIYINESQKIANVEDGEFANSELFNKGIGKAIEVAENKDLTASQKRELYKFILDNVIFNENVDALKNNPQFEAKFVETKKYLDSLGISSKRSKAEYDYFYKFTLDNLFMTYVAEEIDKVIGPSKESYLAQVRGHNWLIMFATDYANIESVKKQILIKDTANKMKDAALASIKLPTETKDSLIIKKHATVIWYLTMAEQILGENNKAALDGLRTASIDKLNNNSIQMDSRLAYFKIFYLTSLYDNLGEEKMSTKDSLFFSTEIKNILTPTLTNIYLDKKNYRSFYIFLDNKIKPVNILDDNYMAKTKKMFKYMYNTMPETREFLIDFGFKY